MVMAKRYSKASAIERQPILNEFVLSTGYERNYAISLLCHPPVSRPVKASVRRRSKTYGPLTQTALEEIWHVAGDICGKRLVPMLPDLIDSLERFNEISLSPHVRRHLLTISAATCDRLLSQARRTHPHGFCTTKPAPQMLLRSQIPVRTFSDWNEQIPGFLEVDLVAHCGDSVRGDYLFTFTGVDVHTGWTRCLPVAIKSMISTTRAMELLRRHLPFPLPGIDTDNGGEFIKFKYRVIRVVEAGKPLAQVARENEIHPNLVAKWRTQLSAYGAEAFQGNGNAYTHEAKV